MNAQPQATGPRPENSYSRYWQAPFNCNARRQHVPPERWASAVTSADFADGADGFCIRTASAHKRSPTSFFGTSLGSQGKLCSD
jgi:hypothetical protein